jgi:group I intron endonuclease
MPRKQYTIHYIYKVICNVTGKYYIGMHSTFNLEDGYMGSGKRIRRSIQKHGLENHVREILEFLPDRSSLKEREKELVNEEILQDPMCMNLQPGGGGGISGEEHHIKLREGASKWINDKWKDPEYLKKQNAFKSERYKKLHQEGKIRYDTLRDKKHSQETKDKIGEKNSIKQKGEKNSQYGTSWISKDGIVLKIKSTELESYLANGWIRGRKRN